MLKHKEDVLFAARHPADMLARGAILSVIVVIACLYMTSVCQFSEIATRFLAILFVTSVVSAAFFASVRLTNGPPRGSLAYWAMFPMEEYVLPIPPEALLLAEKIRVQFPNIRFFVDSFEEDPFLVAVDARHADDPETHGVHLIPWGNPKYQE